MKALIRYFTLRKRAEKLLVESVQFEFEWKKKFIRAHPNEYEMERCKRQIAQYAFLSQKLRELL